MTIDGPSIEVDRTGVSLSVEVATAETRAKQLAFDLSISVVHRQTKLSNSVFIMIYPESTLETNITAYERENFT